MGWPLREDRPIWQQLAEQLTERVVSGQWKAGDKLPSVRELAAQAGVNPNTMQRALGQLEHTGLLYTARTSGRFVTQDEGRLAQIREQVASDYIEEFLVHMAQLGLEEHTILALLHARFEKGEA